MLYTVTFNPCLDYIVSVEDFKLGKTNRTKDELMLPGGKGINVSTVLKNLGFDNTALGFTAGFVGEEIKRRVEQLGIVSDFIELKNGISRINVKLRSIDGTEINGKGPDIEDDEIEKLMKKLDCLTDGDVLFLAGSIPASLPNDIYSRIMHKLQGKDIRIVVDATNELLVNVLKYRPFLIKPNNHELSEIFSVELKTKQDVIPYGMKLREMGARNVLISMASQGAVLISEDNEVYKSEAPKGKLINAVGAGDSMVAGFMAGWLSTHDYKEAFLMGVASGSASAFSENLAKKEEVENVLAQLKGEEK